VAARNVSCDTGEEECAEYNGGEFEGNQPGPGGNREREYSPEQGYQRKN
jgi:hypothetical protein